jgi:hypothetical protein
MERHEINRARRRFAASPEADMVRQYEASRIFGITREIYAKEGRLVTPAQAARLLTDR